MRESSVIATAITLKLAALDLNSLADLMIPLLHPHVHVDFGVRQ